MNPEQQYKAKMALRKFLNKKKSKLAKKTLSKNKRRKLAKEFDLLENNEHEKYVVKKFKFYKFLHSKPKNT